MAGGNAPNSVGSGAIRHDGANLYWQNVDANASYTHNLQFKPTGTSSWSTVSGIAGNSNGVVYYDLLGLSANTTYAFQVQTVCGAGITSAYSTTASLTGARLVMG